MRVCATRLVPALLLLAVTACRREPVLAPSGTPGDSSAAIAVLYDAGLSFGATRAALARRLGRADSMSTRPFPNRHDTTATDTVRYLGYGGLAYIFLQPAQARHEFLLQVESTLPGRPDIRPLRIGSSTAASVRGRLGAAGRTDTLADSVALWYTRPGEAADDMVGLYFLRDTLRLVRWQPYVD